ncbi:probable ATP-dependent RNA helicase vasa-like isoform X2 [Ornithodoros turicata]
MADMSAAFSATGFSLGRGRGLKTVSSSLPSVGAVTNATSNGWAPTSRTGGDSGWDNGAAASKPADSGWNSQPADSWNSTSNGGESSGWDPPSTNGVGCAVNVSDDPWQETPSNDVPSYGGGGGGGGRGDRGGNRRRFGDSDRGFRGSGQRPSRGCFKCGQEGHMSRDCPNADSGGGGGRSGNRGCFKCGQEGHMSRECPNADSGGGRSDNRACFKCGQEGHMSRDCPNADSGGGRSDNRACFKCGQEGHMSRDCPNSGGDSERPKRGCFNCGEDGHMSRDCPNPQQERKKGCFKCGQEGHMSRDCPNADSGGDSRGDSDRPKGCFKCQQEGHMAKDCTNEPVPRMGPDGKPMEAPYIPPALPTDEDSLFSTISTGINFDKYDAIPVEVSDAKLRVPFTSFEEMGLCDLLKSNLRRAKYTKPTPVQKYAIKIVLAGRDLMACAQTGSGKTAAFMLPILHSLLKDPNLENPSNREVQTPLAVVLSPTRELAIQIANDANKYGYDSILKTVLLYGGTSVNYQLSQLSRGCHILVATTGRLKDFVERGKVSFEKLRYLVLDEADRMLDMGFEADIRAICGNPSIPAKGQRQTLMFSATFPESIQMLAREFLHDSVLLSVGILGSANSDVQQRVFKVTQFEKRQKLLEILNEEGSDRVMVFVEKKKTADFLAAFISQKAIKTTSIHGDRFQRQREEALTDFRRGVCPVIVATAVAARGLDIKDVRHVVNYDLPQSIDEYVHRVGRTGRVGNLGRATSFYDSDANGSIARALVKTLSESQQEVPDWLEHEAKYGGSGGDFGGGANCGGDAPQSYRSESWGSTSGGAGYSAQPCVEEESWG